MITVLRKPITWLILAVALAGILAYLYNSISDDAAAIERAKQEKANAEFSVRANKGVVSYDTCDRADGVYDFAKGTCQLPAAR